MASSMARANAHGAAPHPNMLHAAGLCGASASLFVDICAPPIRPEKLAAHYLQGWGAVGGSGLVLAKKIQKIKKSGL